VLRLHAELPPDDRYLRFFSAGTAQLDQLADLVVSDSAVAVGAFRSGELVGVAHYRREPAGTPPEVAVVVRHDQQHRGVATLLFEYLFAVARSEGVTQVDADVLAVNQGVSVVLRDLGLPVRSTCFSDVREVVLRVPETGTTTASERYVQAMLERSIQSDVTSLRPVLAPRSVVVIGGSGTGKSVMIKSILGIIRPDSGSITIGGEEVTGLRGKERDQLLLRFGMLFQGAALFDSLPVWENVAFGLIQGRNTPRKEARDIAMEKLGQVGLGPEVGGLYPAELSGGMQKRVGLARAVAADPEIIFFDEPTTGLDPIMADVINNLIVDCVKRLGATTISITHDMVSARKIADRIAMIHKGEIIWQGPARAIDTSGNPFVDQFIHGRAEGPIQMEILKP